MLEQYTVLPRFYDALNTEANYEEYLDYLERNLPKNSSVIDLGCGTGNISIGLSKRHFDVVGLDSSSEMLSEAFQKSEREGVRVFYTCQDMTSFTTPSRFDAAVSCFDSLNYILTKEKLLSAFIRISDALADGGVFIFDMNAPAKFERVYGENTFVLEEDGIFCAWENEYNKKTRKCKFYINIFVEDNNKYNRYYEEQTEKCYKLSEITSLLGSAGFELVSVSSDFYSSPVTLDTQRYYFIARKI